MSAIAFKVTSGQYAASYSFEVEDFTATELLAFRQQLEISLEAVLSGDEHPGLYVLAGLVWLQARRRAKGLAFNAVADTITARNVEEADTVEETASPES
jgi:hypothetical protein